MDQKKYWKGLEELNETPDHKRVLENEFSQDITQEDNSKDGLLEAPTQRRDFLKFLGFSTLAATVAASCEMPVRYAVPYAIKPDAEKATPGIANYYASTYVDNGEAVSVVVKTKEGRPILIEGNSLSSIFKGSVNSRVIASTLGLYDTARLRGPMFQSENVDLLSDIDKQITQQLASATGSIVILTGTINSPTTLETINRFISKYPNAKHVQFDPISYSGMIVANGNDFGKKAIPAYRFDQAKTIFSIGADFLGTWLSPAEFTSQYIKNRKFKSANPDMSKHYQVEALMTTTGASADERATCKPSEYGQVALALYKAITSGTKANFPSAKLNAMIDSAAKELKSTKGLVVSGSNDANVQSVINAINSAINAYGSTIDFSVTSNQKKAIDTDMVQLVKDMNAGTVGAIILHGVNPSYEYYDAAQFNEGLAKVKVTISTNDRLDETTEKMAFKVPSHHWLESWGDAEVVTGYYSFVQPTINPLFKTRQFQDSLLVWAGSTDNYYTIFNNYWSSKLGGQVNFDKALQNGVAEPANPTIGSGVSSISLNSDVESKVSKTINAGEFEIIAYESIAMGHGGVHSNNPWLHELPDAISKTAWDNFIMMSPKTAKAYDAELTGINQVDPNKRVLKITVNGKEETLPVVVIPGMHHQVIAVAIGYGRSQNVGMAANGTGKNAYPFVTFDGQTFSYNNPVTIEQTADTFPVAITQTHHSYENRPIIREFTLNKFKENPVELINSRRKELNHYVHKSWEHHEEYKDITKASEFDARQFELDFAKNGSLYPVHEKQGIHWGMSIDLNACTGCGACVVACYAENNVSIVGKHQVMKAREMAWLRIDRYFSGDPEDADSIQAVFQPMMCQHCDNAPCENVCPVSATNHSNEGLNQMAYNRCIGTKYCANNCPYKVRRFNWFDFNGADSIEGNPYLDGKIDSLRDDLTRMVLNPDVTVRSKGVIEKCSFCVQRLQEGKLAAKLAGEPVTDKHISTACQKACAGDCITFGNINDVDSAVYKERYVDNKERVFYVLEQLHVLPNVSYLSKIRNTEEIIAGKENDGIYQQHI